jgi:hypothetical protein
MRQTFVDLCRERSGQHQSIHGLALRMYCDTILQISKERIMSIRNIRKGVVAVFAVTGAILAIPLIAMQFSTEANWTSFDFVVAGTMLLVSGLTAEYLWRLSGSFEYRAASLLTVFTGLFMLWVNLAVGIIGNEDHPANTLYSLVLIVGISGAFAARFRPAGMAVAMTVTAILLAAIPVVAFFLWRMPLDIAMVRTFVLNSMLALSLAGSARMFARAGNAEMRTVSAG